MAHHPSKRSVDWRISAGVVMVLSGGIGTTVLIGWMDTTRPYLTVVTDVSEGHTLTSADLTAVDIHVRQGGVPYLLASDRALAEGARVTRSLTAGELIPASALGSLRALDTTTITLAMKLGGAPWLLPGSRVDVWMSPAIEQGSYGPPRIVTSSAVVSGVRSEEGFAADPSLVNVDIRVVRRDAPAILGALANSYPLHLTPSYTGDGR
jgi:hypothetical protein